ncbi:MMPL family transporter [Paenibacillus sp.]|jgi:RND superfamily putative drug exporter|uniref:MMPL family transporter n=1 Tax=Paenibacillus sp. TaxID=58172 RepID=UPI00281D0FEA|nr:MMPL family transporter [Paenibacillus sp.]MDR0270393.1 MMPL family transporter [Paenibacillus sp.]
MRQIIKWRWAILVFWLVVTVLLTVFQPDVNAILHERGQDPLTEDSPSKVAGALLSKMNGTSGTSDIIVFHREGKLTDEDMKDIKSGIENMIEHQSELGFSQLIDPITSPDAKSALISEDNTTLMASFTLDKMGRNMDDIDKQFKDVLKGVHVPYYLSGQDFIENDYIKASTAGVEKSAALTVIFILVVLILMFRSLVIPFVSLLAVGISYLCSMGIAAQIIDKLNFPVTSVTQMLLVLILFGIGTDYNILLFNRFKEELGHGRSVDEAIIASYKTAGKTIIYSIATVFIAFAGLSFSSFGIYKSANVVAIGTVVLVLQILTLTPFMLKVFGPKLFWPSKKEVGHKESKFWAKLTSISVKHPIVVTVIIVLLLIPALLTSGQKLSFDQLKELGDGYPSTKGFSIVAEHFSRGQALPTTVVIEDDKAMDNNDTLSVIDKLTDKVKAIDGVKSVASVTQPGSKPIDDFYISNQTETVRNGISSSQKGVDQIKSGLDEIGGKLNTPDASSASQLVNGTSKVKDGYDQITVALGQVSSGIDKGAGGAGELSKGIAGLKSGINTVSANTEKISKGLSELSKGYTSLEAGYNQVGGRIQQIQQALTGMNGLIAGLGAKYSELAKDADYVKLAATSETLAASLAQLSGGLQELNKNHAKLNASLGETAVGLSQIASAQKQMSAGLEALQKGADELQKGLQQGGSGSREIEANMKKLNGALGQVQSGQKQLVDGLASLTGGMSQLKEGIGKSGSGLSDISEGLSKTGDFLTQLNSSKTFFIPREALDSENFKKAEDNFMSKDRKITKMIVILKDDPYSPAALKTIEKINDTLSGSLKGTVLDNASYGAAGPSSTTYDVNKEQLNSFNSTAIIVIVGVFVVLLFVIRSFWPAVFIVLSLVASYYVAMSASNLVTTYIVGADGVSSFVPFFSFIVIVAVGVDYSIFLMERYREHGDLSPGEAIVKAAKSVGGVIISAMIILGGTFATLIPSGLVLLIELASAVIVGLIVLCFILLPMLVPALITLPGSIQRRRAEKLRVVHINGKDPTSK